MGGNFNPAPGGGGGGGGPIAATDVTSGVFDDARIQESNVTQHEGAITITESQISDLGPYADATHTHVAGDITSGTFADALVAQSNITQHQSALAVTESQITDLQSYALTGHTHDATDIISGLMADARIQQSNVTQHQGALSITESQISDLGNYANASHTHDATDIVSGVLADARVQQSNVTQHQAALSVTESQISDLQSYALTGHTHTLADVTDSGALAALNQVDTAEIVDDAVTDAKLSNTGVTDDEYTYATVSVNAQGRVTAANSNPLPGIIFLLSTDITTPVNGVVFNLDMNYDRFMLVGDAITSSNDNNDLWIRFSNDNGATFLSGGTSYGWNNTRIGTGSASTDTNDAQIEMTVGEGIGNATGESASFRCEVFNAYDTTVETMVKGSVILNENNSTVETVFFGGNRRNAEANSHIQVSLATGTIDSGRISLYAYNV